MEATKNWLFKNLVWLLTIVGISLFLIGHFSSDVPDSNLSFSDKFFKLLPSALKGVGVAVLSSGIFAAILKSIQFSGIFQEELAKVIYSRNYLEKQDRKFLEDIWKLTSKVLYTQRFPKINEKIETIVLKHYFPSDHKYYFENFRVFYNNIDIINENGTDYVTYEQVTSGKLVPIDEKGKFPWINIFRYEVDAASYREVTKITITKCSNHEVTDLTEEFKTTGKSGRYEKLLDCENEYEFWKGEKRKFPLNISSNELQDFSISKVTNGMIISISFSKNVRISFVSKTVSEFQTLNNTEGKLTMEHKELLLPSQGFCLILGKI